MLPSFTWMKCVQPSKTHQRCLNSIISLPQKKITHPSSPIQQRCKITLTVSTNTPQSKQRSSKIITYYHNQINTAPTHIPSTALNGCTIFYLTASLALNINFGFYLFNENWQRCHERTLEKSWIETLERDSSAGNNCGKKLWKITWVIKNSKLLNPKKDLWREMNMTWNLYI